VDSDGNISRIAGRFAHFVTTRWTHTEASGLTTELTTLSDITVVAATGKLLSRSRCSTYRCCSVIANAAVPVFFRITGNSYARLSAYWVTIFVGQSWTSTLASHFGSRPQSFERWTCWRARVTRLGVKWFVKRLSVISRPNSEQSKKQIQHEVVEYPQSVVPGHVVS
jgi:hypothetical protein